MRTYLNTAIFQKFGVVLAALAAVFLLTACPGPKSTDWRGPVALNSHLVYLDGETGRVLLVDPRKADGDGLVVELPGPEDPDDLREGFVQVLVFPDKSHLVYAAQDTNAFHIVSDAERKVVLSIEDVPPIINAAAFSPDGRWLIFHVSKDTSNHTRETRPTYPAGINRRLSGFDFPNSGSILLNEHRLIVVDRETMETFSLDLPRNDVPIDGLWFTGAFRICATGVACAERDARLTELVVASGRGRVWIFDPTDGSAAKVGVVPISDTNSGDHATVLTLRVSANLVEPSDGTDNRETLFMITSGSRDVLALNMMWNTETDGLSFTLNMLPMGFRAEDIEPYADRDGLYLMALGDGRLASIHTESARTSQFSVSYGASHIRPLVRGGDTTHMLLVGGDSLGMVKLRDFAVFGAKNITTATIGFSPRVVEIGDGEKWRALCLDREFSRLAAIDLEALTSRNLSASVQRLGQDVDSVLPLADEGRLYLSGICRIDRYRDGTNNPLLCDLFALDLFEQEAAITQVTLEDVDSSFHYLPATEDAPLLFVFEDVDRRDRLFTVSAKDFEIVELSGFLSAAE